MENSTKLIERGFELHKKGDIKKALKLYIEVLSSQKSNPKLFFLIGTAYLQIGNFREAVNYFNKTITLDPNNLGAYNNLGAAFQNLKQYNEGVKIYKKLISINPNFSDGYNNLGNCLIHLNKYERAIENFNKTVELNPDNFVAITNLANAQKEIFKFEEAINNYEKSINLNKNYLLAYNNLANTFHELGKYEEAVKNYKKVFEINRNYKFILGRLIHSQMYLCDWEGYKENIDLLVSGLKGREKICAPFVVLSNIDSPELQKICSEINAKEKAPSENYEYLKIKKKNEKYKIGYFSSDFRNHPVLHLIRDVFKYHDKSKFKIYGFSFEPQKNDEMTREIKDYFSEFIEVKHMSNEYIRDLCRNKDLDIAIDLCGFTSYNRFEIFSYRLAPIQINYLGYPGTMGSKCFDYIIADKNTIPKEEQGNYSEKIIYLTNCYQPNSNYQNIKENSFIKKNFSLPEKKIIYSNLGSNHKITPQMFDTWMNILKKVPESILWLMTSNEYAMNNIRNEASKKDIEKGRIIFANHLPHNDHLERLKLADIFLDTFPYNAHTTASDSIRMGVPIVTLSGRSFASRVCTSILNQVKMEKLSAKSLKNYENIAIELGNNKNKLNQVKKEIKNNCINSSLFKVQDYTKDLEKKFIELIEKQEV